MTKWTEAQIDRHLHLWEHRHGPDSPEAGIVRQLRAERDAARGALEWYENEVRLFSTDTTERADRAEALLDVDGGRRARAALLTTQETPHEGNE